MGYNFNIAVIWGFETLWSTCNKNVGESHTEINYIFNTNSKEGSLHSSSSANPLREGAT
jgi:hypothetical protein